MFVSLPHSFREPSTVAAIDENGSTTKIKAMSIAVRRIVAVQAVNSKVFVTTHQIMAQDIGILCHVTSLPNGLQDGEKFIDYVHNYGASVWQILPITPPDSHGSPYASPSAFAAWSSLGQADEIDMTEDSYWLRDWLLLSLIHI